MNKSILTQKLISCVKEVLEEYEDSDFTRQTVREIVSTVIYSEIKDIIDKHNERGL